MTTFTGAVSALANLNTVQKMVVVDGGYAVGRVSTERNNNAKAEIAFKMAGMMFLNFVAPKWIAKALDGLTGAKLDPIMLADKTFRQQIKDGTFQLPKSSAAEDLFEFIDSNPNSLFNKYGGKLKKITLLENGVRDPRAWVDVEKLGKFRDNIEEFAKKAAPDAEKIIKRTGAMKYVNILTNIGLSSFLLAYCLPKAQFAFRQKITGSNLEPGIAGDAQKKGVSV
jgi:hypothetical protein